MNFIERHGCWSAEQKDQAAEVLERVARDEIDLVRFSFPDLHGILRGKALTAPAVPAALRDGVSITSTLLLKDSSHHTVAPIFSAGAGLGSPRFEGGGDVVMVPDPATFRCLPWARGSAWMMCDLHYTDGSPVPHATRNVARNALTALATHKRAMMCGLEVEFHLFRRIEPHLAIDDGGQPGAPPEVGLLHQGYNYLTDNSFDQLSPIVDILRREVMALGLPLISTELEFGPSQCEFVFKASPALAAADDMILFRTAVKQVSARHGYHATFMCRPAFANAMSSGWHLHQSLADDQGRNTFAGDAGTGLSGEGLTYLAGLLDHASAFSAFGAPTINAYKRYRPNSLAPDRIAWGRDNRGAMLRVIDGLSPSATRIENRSGEPAANPYLYIAGQAIAGLSGIEAARQPPPPVETPYAGDLTLLPRSLEEALVALDRSALARTRMGDEFVDYFLMVKRHEIERFRSAVTDWEHREYFGAF
ncbi:MAG TPA: glutamine synthetase family protein [Sphingomonas sp.]|nr:glutamine synthetase family protein [Sphingomonas sp.]